MLGPPAWWAHGFTCGQNRMQIFCSGFAAMFSFGHTFLLLLRPKSPDRSVPDSNNTLYIWNRRSRLYSSCLARICWLTERDCMRNTCRATYRGRWKTPTFLLLHIKLGTYHDMIWRLCYNSLLYRRTLLMKSGNYADWPYEYLCAYSLDVVLIAGSTYNSWQRNLHSPITKQLQ